VETDLSDGIKERLVLGWPLKEEKKNNVKESGRRKHHGKLPPDGFEDVISVESSVRKPASVQARDGGQKYGLARRLREKEGARGNLKGVGSA